MKRGILDVTLELLGDVLALVKTADLAVELLVHNPSTSTVLVVVSGDALPEACAAEWDMVQFKMDAVSGLDVKVVRHQGEAPLQPIDRLVQAMANAQYAVIAAVRDGPAAGARVGIA